MSIKNIKPTEGEMEILQVLWQHGHCTLEKYMRVKQKGCGIYDHA
jgi:hypothetical protein